MPVPIVYRKSQDNVVASYNYSDVASGAGYVNFYLCVDTNSTTTTYNLTEIKRLSYVETVQLGTSEFKFYSAPFKVQRQILGNALVSFIAGATASAGTDNFTIEIFKVSGITETSISTAVTTQEISQRGTSSIAPDGSFIAMTIPLTTISLAVGDKIMVKIVGTGDVNLGTSPSNTMYQGPNTPIFRNDSYIAIPFRIDL